MTAAGSAKDSTRSTPEIVAEGLRGKILDGTIGPGERINVRELGRLLKVSHIPIREAVRLLEAEGLVETKMNVGAVAAGISLAELDDVYELRRIIEPAVARRAAAATSDEHIDRLRAALHELEELEKNTESMDSRIISANRRFHWDLLAPGSSPLIERTLHSLWRISERYVQRTRAAAMSEAGVQHAQMVALCEQRDGDALADLVHEHLHLTASTLRILYDQDPES
jgi:DNA-binding GntR family transcriptional regulator